MEKWIDDGQKTGDAERRTPPEQGEEPTSVEVMTVNDIVEDLQDSQFYAGMFGSMSEGCFVAKQEADSRFHFGLEMLNVSLEGEFTV